MKILKFENISGDPAYSIAIVDIELSQDDIRKIVINNIGDDYGDDEDEIFGTYWIEEFEKVSLASELLLKVNNV